MSKFELGVISGKEIGVVFSDAKKIIMLPVNVSNTSTVNAVLETANSKLTSNRTILKWGMSIFLQVKDYLI